jgi:hypothetical protein
MGQQQENLPGFECNHFLQIQPFFIDIGDTIRGWAKAPNASTFGMATPVHRLGIPALLEKAEAEAKKVQEKGSHEATDVIGGELKRSHKPLGVGSILEAFTDPCLWTPSLDRLPRRTQALLGLLDAHCGLLTADPKIGLAAPQDAEFVQAV